MVEVLYKFDVRDAVRGVSLVYLLGEVTGTVWSVEDLIVKDGEVERQSQANGMRGLHLALAHVKRLLIRLLRLVHDALTTESPQTRDTRARRVDRARGGAEVTPRFVDIFTRGSRSATKRGSQRESVASRDAK